MGVPCDYDTDPDRYRLGVRSARAHTAADLYGQVARLLGELGARTVLDVGCADGPLRAALSGSGPWLVGVDVSAVLLRDHPAPVVRADAARLPIRDGVLDAVTALNVLYHLADPVPALREARRVLHSDGHLVAATIARTDSPELSAYWSRPATSFDAEDAPGLLARVFDSVAVFPWDAPLVTLPDAAAVRDYLVGRRAPLATALAAARELRAPVDVTKRGAVLVAGGRPWPTSRHHPFKAGRPGGTC
ncbi:class I SAM-dependent methyltransferase [Geodermatophilus sp. YIM 151500]|uniref:class I SAM-dependent methyltransferase n=1 Tax=Geodermatophilus sp. YIM 151500 TaxID=2984531 RepID=UPI0021E4098C|nr:class I SAM-dependent methyltransferase [Geodermatophilus sp. YIM 151500]MCV2489790.1 class I SAM-dependent methyltransferase [Geodermatophilus sp. YIM 151500]